MCTDSSCTAIGNENCLLYHGQDYDKHRYKAAEVTFSIISDHSKLSPNHRLK